MFYMWGAILALVLLIIILADFIGRNRKEIRRIRRSYNFTNDYVRSMVDINTETTDGIYRTIGVMMKRIEKLEDFLKDDMEQDAIMNGKDDD